MLYWLMGAFFGAGGVFLVIQGGVSFERSKRREKSRK